MRILVANHLYHPILGGSIVLTDAIVEELQKTGHAVRLTTKTGGTSPKDSEFQIHRQPGFFKLLQLMRWSEGVIIIEPSIGYCCAAWIARRPAVATLQTWFANGYGVVDFRTKLRRWISSAICTISSPSKAISKSWGGGHPIIPNGYEADVFRPLGLPRVYDYIFLGRMIADKGPDLFINSLARIHEEGTHFRAIVIGDGDLLPQCKETVSQYPGLDSKVEFTGEIRDRGRIADLLNRSSVLVIPNRWEEPFGMVALEALSCGCRLVVTDSGALAEVAGPYAKVVPMDDLPALAKAMAETRESAPASEAEVNAYLAKFRWSTIVTQYLSVIRRGTGTRREIAPPLESPR